MKLSLDRVIVTEGKYDKIRLSNIFDAVIVTTEGFGIFKSTEKAAYIRRLAESKGIIIVTDSDSAGAQIRNRLRELVRGCEVINVYVPSLKGKERRKTEPSREGLLGVEGIKDSLIIEAFERAGALTRTVPSGLKRPITGLELYNAGLTGAVGSAERRRELKRLSGLPDSLSQAALLEALNSLYTYEEFIGLAERLSEKAE